MVAQALEGFDKYGGVNTNTTVVNSLLTGEWALSSTGMATIVAGLSAVGQAIQLNIASAQQATKALGASFSRLIGGIRFNVTSAAAAGIQFIDNVTAQSGICINTSGTIAIRNGVWNTGTVIATSTAVATPGTTHYLEWDFTFTSTGAYNVWLDGTNILTGTGNLVTTANNSSSALSLAIAANAVAQFDDLYVFDSTGSANNAAVLTSPRVETTFPISDSSVVFSIGAAVIGNPNSQSSATNAFAANLLVLRPLTAARNMTINTIYILPTVTQSAAQWRTVIYADSSGVPGALLGNSANLLGVTANVQAAGALATAVNLTAGTQYWVGFMSNTSLTIQNQDALSLGRTASATFTSGAPSTAPTMTTGQATPTCWGAVTSTGANYYEVSQAPAPSNYSYVYDSTTGAEDLYNFNNLSVVPTTIYAVQMKAWASKSDTGSRTFSLRISSGGTDSGGSLTGQALGTSYQWYQSMFPTDPSTTLAWTGAGLNAAIAGFRVDS